MLLLFVDESGAPQDGLFVVSGLLVDERAVERLVNDAQDLANSFPGEARGSEIHTSAIRGGRQPWARIPPEVRNDLLRSVGDLIASHAGASESTIFAVALDGIIPADSVLPAYRELFDLCGDSLGPMPRTPRRCLIVSDRVGQLELPLQRAMLRWRDEQWSDNTTPLAPYLGVPLFVDSQMSRPVQLADFVANTVYRLYRSGDDRLFNLIKPHFGGISGLRGGLRHLNAPVGCACPACGSR